MSIFGLRAFIQSKKNTMHLAEIANKVRTIHTSYSEPTPDIGENGDLFFVIESPDYSFYDEGQDADDWVVGYSNGNGSQSKEADHLYLAIDNNASNAADRTYVTDAKIDCTLLNVIYIDYEVTDAHDNFNARFAISEGKNTNSGSANVTKYRDASGNRSRRTTSIDVSAVTGEYYLRVAARDAGTFENRPGKLKVYKVWGEE